MIIAPCTCATPNADCRRSGHVMTGRLWELCAGVNCTPEESIAYRRLWDGLAAATPPKRSLCVYLGADIGERRICPSCRGRVELKVLQCRHPTHTAEPTTTVTDCSRCADYCAPPTSES
jgi:hypothetical protein